MLFLHEVNDLVSYKLFSWYTSYLDVMFKSTHLTGSKVLGDVPLNVHQSFILKIKILLSLSTFAFWNCSRYRKSLISLYGIIKRFTLLLHL